MKNIVFIGFLILICNEINAQQISNVHFEQQGKEIIIYYDLNGNANEQYDISVYCSTDGRNTWGSKLNHVSGEVGKKISPGINHQITWDVLAEQERLVGEVRFEVIATNSLGIEWIFVEGGTFQMGSNIGDDDEKPVHTVTISDFYLSKYEITHKQYIDFLNAAGVNPDGSKDGEVYLYMDYICCSIGYQERFFFQGSQYADNENCPITGVTWYGAEAFCKWAGGRLPSEAEWKYAARGGNKSRGYTYSGSNTLNEVGWFLSNSESRSHPVGQKGPNEIGLYDMSGNVMEWCSDWYDAGYYSHSPESVPQGPSSGECKLLCGGSFLSFEFECRSASRFGFIKPTRFNYGVGFRVARDL